MLELNFSPFPKLSSERLNFRRILKTDVKEMFGMRSDPEVMRYIPRPLAKNHDDALALIQMMDDKIDNNEGINWGITLKNSDILIGMIGFFRTQHENYRSEIGYSLVPQFHNKGFISEAVKTALIYGFENMKLHSVEAIIDPNNIASEKVLLKNGFKKEAHFIENHFFEGEFLDSVYYSLLKKNWIKK